MEKPTKGGGGGGRNAGGKKKDDGKDPVAEEVNQSKGGGKDKVETKKRKYVALAFNFPWGKNRKKREKATRKAYQRPEL